MAWVGVGVVAHKMSIDSQPMDYKWVNKCLAIEHMCRRDFVLRHSVMAMKWPLRGKECFYKVHDYHPSYDCVRVWFDRQDKEVGVIVPWQQESILASNQDTPVD